MNDTTIRRVAFLSMSHITEDDYHYLCNCPNQDHLVWIEKGEPEGYGIWLYIGEDDEFLEYRPGIQAVIEWALRNNIYYVRLTPDEEPLNELPTYDWS